MSEELQQEEENVNSLCVKWSAIIKLNVGGEKFTTALTTLTQQSDSMLAAMFSGRHTLIMDEEKNVFIDRDGGLFR